MKRSGIVKRTCAVVNSLIRGAIHDRKTISDAFGVTVAAGDRYIRELRAVPGMLVIKTGRRLTVRWSFSEAIREAGL